MYNQNGNRSAMGHCLSVTWCSGHDGHDGAQELRQIISEATDTSIAQYPIDDTTPVKAWVYETKLQSKINYKPLRPEDQRKALEVLNRHLPSWDQIEIPQPPALIPDKTAGLRPRVYTEVHLPLPPRSGTRRERREAAARPHGSPQKATSTKRGGNKVARRLKTLNWIQTDNNEEGNASIGGIEEDPPVLVVPDLVVTRPDGETRRLRDPNEYISTK
ncbi:hypothetical protein DHEL01_v206468 [Diaporthe helianthi]|uniref:Uncharacterized protein n=1 Tax=Diaporthe helianthi TaxID=158607 RepID=A0A2P5HY11_DIAHE|nr:hypothetical protein DHEL01_v206468 [Diaporthe helianthi]